MSAGRTLTFKLVVLIVIQNSCWGGGGGGGELMINLLSLL